MSSIFSSINIIYFFIFTILLTSPLPYGSVTAGGRMILQVQAFIILALYSLYVYRHEKPFFDFRNKFQPLAVLIFLIVCIVQIIPLPGTVLELISGASYEIWHQSQNLLKEVAGQPERFFYTISLDPHRTWMDTVELLSYLSTAFVVSRMFNTDKRLRLLLLPLFILSVFEASYGIYQYISDLGVTDLFFKNIATGTFVNRNNYAGLMEMTIPLILAYTLSLYAWNPRRSFIKNITSSDNFSKQFLMLFILGLMLLALVFSLSRMGIMVAFLSLIFFWVIHSSITKQRKTNIWIVVFIIVIVGLYGLAIGIYPAFERFVALKEATPERVIVWADMLSAVRDFPVFGTGLGTFSYIYLLYNNSIQSPVEFVYAHNDYLQLVIETGIPAALLLLSALGLFLKSSYRTIEILYLSGENFRFYLGLGALTGVVAILIHSLADFNLHIPSNAAYFAILMGILAAIGRVQDGDPGKVNDDRGPVLKADLTKSRIRKKLREK